MVGSRDTNRGLDLQQQGLGASMFGQGVSGQASLGQGMFNTGQQQQQAPWNTINAAGGAYSPFTGLGSSSTQTSQQGGGTAGAIGGLLSGLQLGNQYGLFNGLTGGGGGSSVYGGTGFGTGSLYGNEDYGQFF